MRLAISGCLIVCSTAASAEIPDPDNTLARWREADRAERYEDAVLIVEDDLAKAREAGPLGLAWANVMLNYAFMRSQSMCNYTRALELLDEAIALATVHGNEGFLAAGHYFRAIHYASYGQIALAKADADIPQIKASAVLGEALADYLERLLERPPGFASSAVWRTCGEVSLRALESLASGDVRLGRRMASAAMLPPAMDNERHAAIHNVGLLGTLARIAYATDDITGLREIIQETVLRVSEPGASPGTLRRSFEALPNDDSLFWSLERVAFIAQTAGIEDENTATLLRWSAAAKYGEEEQPSDMDKLRSIPESDLQAIIAFTEELLASDDVPAETAFFAEAELEVAKAKVAVEEGERARAIAGLSASISRLTAESDLPVSMKSSHLAWMASELAFLGGLEASFDAYTRIWEMERQAFRATNGTSAEEAALIERSKSHLQFAIALAKALDEISTDPGSETDCQTLYDLEICTARFAAD